MGLKVRFDENVKIYPISASKSERKSLWMQYAADRQRFQRRISSLDSMLSKVIRDKLQIVNSKLSTRGGHSPAAVAGSNSCGTQRCQMSTSSRRQMQAKPGGGKHWQGPAANCSNPAATIAKV